jgi:hypothetical protein
MTESILECSELEYGPYVGPLSRVELLALTEMIIELGGTQHPAWKSEKRIYEDNVIRIETSVFRGEREIELERVFNRNPVLMAAGGKVFRYHGENGYIVPHMIRLVNRLMADVASEAYND